MADILITDFPMSLNGRWGSCSDHIVIHGDGSVTYTDGHNFGNAKAIEVVRCKDCKRCVPDAVCGQIGRLWCKLRRLVKPDDFCSYGKRKEE